MTARSVDIVAENEIARSSRSASPKSLHIPFFVVRNLSNCTHSYQPFLSVQLVEAKFKCQNMQNLQHGRRKPRTENNCWENFFYLLELPTSQIESIFRKAKHSTLTLFLHKKILILVQFNSYGIWTLF